MGRSVVITSGKGGAGKTSLTAGVASCLAALGHSVACVDADVGLRNLDLALGLQDRAVFDFSDVLYDRAELSDALVEHPDIKGLFLLAAPLGASAGSIDRGAFAALISELAGTHDFVFVDSMAGVDEGFSLAAGACESAIVVSTPDRLSMRDATLCAERLTGQSPAHIVVNRVKPKLIRLGHAPTIDELMDGTGLPLLGVVPEDEMVIAAQNHGLPIILVCRSGAAVAYLDIAERMLGKKRPLPRRIRQWSVDV